MSDTSDLHRHLGIYDPRHPEHHLHVTKIYGPYDRVEREVPEIPSIDLSVFSPSTKMKIGKLIEYFDKWVKLPMVFDEHSDHGRRRIALEELQRRGFVDAANILDETRFGGNKFGVVINFMDLVIESLYEHRDLFSNITRIWESKKYKIHEYDRLPSRKNENKGLSKEEVLDDLEDKVLTILEIISEHSHGLLSEHQKE